MEIPIIFQNRNLRVQRVAKLGLTGTSPHPLQSPYLASFKTKALPAEKGKLSESDQRLPLPAKRFSSLEAQLSLR